MYRVVKICKLDYSKDGFTIDYLLADSETA